MSIHRTPSTDGTMTIFDAFRAASGVSWVEQLPTGQLAILCKVSGTSVLVRDAGDVNRRGQRSGYHWTGVTSLRRRQDLDGVKREPTWLQDARDSRRRNLDLHNVLEPTHSESALTTDEAMFERFYGAYRVHRQAQAEQDWPRLFGADVAAQYAARFAEEQQLARELAELGTEGGAR